MNKEKKLSVVITLNLIIVFLELIGVGLAASNHRWGFFKYYTENSNLLCLIFSAVYVGFLLKVKKGVISEMPEWLRAARVTFLTGLVLTFIVVVLVLGPAIGGIEGYIYVLFTGSMLFGHTLCPITSFVSYVFFEKDLCKCKKNHTIIPVIYTFIYAVVLVILNLLRVVDGPYPFLKVYNQPWWASVLWFVSILLLVYYIAIKLVEVHNPPSWVRIRHKVVWLLLRIPVSLLCILMYNVKAKWCKDKRPLLILANHQTPFDQFFVAMSFAGPLYFLATEDIFSNGFVSKLIKYLVEPVPIQKGTLDVKSIKNCIKIAKEGGSVVIFPEGNRTYSGQTETIKSSIVKLIKMLKLPVAFYRIEGGYGVEPRWSNVRRRGVIYSGVSRIMEPEEYEQLDSDEFFEILSKELMVDDNNGKATFKSNKKAENLERVMYVCPQCKFTTFASKGNMVKCTKCNREYLYTDDLKLVGNGFDNPFDNMKKWIGFQEAYVSGCDFNLFRDKPLYEDMVMVSRLVPYKRKEKLEERTGLYLFGNRVKLVMNKDLMDYSFDEITSMVVLGRNKLNITMDNLTYQIKGDKSFNAVKYVNFYYHYRNVKEGKNDKFLGL